ncbi:response regulator transcription factor [Undibacterium cyanobacteriorum]|uniref:Response regulator transcription factor n=1 Tax=Undibacterium cyanobacteriorum TaxID=3073561 RepID=A0ABY9RFM8_9BURK|nr:response regulator transcription factor [Undibacterium sp. 20NA77.5]WMW80032.1 response regulator transcription factor [Undibacterium sp. 20NA77.5]
MRILLVEDDSILGDGLQSGLRQCGFVVDWVRDGVAAEYELRSHASGEKIYAAAVLDLGLPRAEGSQVLKNIRQHGVQTPVLILTARDSVSDKLTSFDSGADDYVVKPVDLLELAARLHALIRRSHGQTQNKIRLQDLEIDIPSRQAKLNGQELNLSAREFDVLHALMLNADRVLSREQIEKNLYSWGHEVESNTVEVYVHKLRKKLGNQLIHTVRGVGYLMRKETS